MGSNSGESASPKSRESDVCFSMAIAPRRRFGNHRLVLEHRKFWNLLSCWHVLAGSCRLYRSARQHRVDAYAIHPQCACPCKKGLHENLIEHIFYRLYSLVVLELGARLNSLT